MTSAKKTDRITNKLLETALALSKHKLLSAQELNQITMYNAAGIYGGEGCAHQSTQSQDEPSSFCWFS